jgi:hypothetical protein
MSISGSLEDVSVADVMQFIHLGRRTGTLVLRRGGREALIGFHCGRLVSAQAPGQERLGALLVRSGVLSQDSLDRAVEDQADGASHRSLGQILVSSGDVDAQALRDAIVRQIEATVAEVVTWNSGSFEFVVDDLRPVDDIALYPGDVLPDSDINTQMVLLEAARIFDERSRAEGAEDGEDDTLPLGTERSAARAELGGSRLGAPESGAGWEPDPLEEALDDAQLGSGTGAFRRLWLDIVCPDDTFVYRLREALPPVVPHVGRVSLEEACVSTPASAIPIALVDLRDHYVTLEALRAFHRARPRVTSVVLLEPGASFAHSYAAGARAALPAEVDGIIACLSNLLQLYRVKPAAEEAESHEGRDGVARLRRVFGDLRSGLISATVALNLMHIISESVERAVLFLVKRDQLVALGAFGMGVDGRPLAELTRALRLELGEENALTWTLQESEARSMSFEEAGLPESFARLVGRPKTGQIVVFPVLGAQRVIALIYTDNGEQERLIEDIEILELATAQVGMAFENELLRRQISQK